MKSFTRSLFLAVAIIASIFAATNVFAAGNIDGVQKYSQFLNVDLDNNDPAGSSTPTNDFINWSPTNAGATVSSTDLSGYIWGESVGWINLHPTNIWVANTSCGELGGYAWGQNTGWINFAPTNATGLNRPAIDPTTGAITGTVWSQNYGWIQLNSQDGTWPGLQTTWTDVCSGGGTDGVCGIANGDKFSNAPSSPSALCTDGTASSVVPISGGWIWTCAGSGGGATASCSADKKIVGSTTPTLVVKKVVVGGTLAPGAFTLHIKENGVEDHAISPFQGSSAGKSISVDTSVAHTFTVSEDAYAGYTVSFSGDCDATGKVSFSINDSDLEKNCTVTNTFGVGPNPEYCLNIAGLTLTGATSQGYTLIPNTSLNGFDCLKKSGPQYCANHTSLTLSDAQNLGYTIDANNNCTKKGYCANDTMMSIAEAQNLGYVIDANNNCTKTVGEYCKNDTTLLIKTAMVSGYTVDIDGNCNKKSFVCANLGTGYTQVPKGYHVNDQGNCVPDTIDVCPDVLGIQTSTADCAEKTPKSQSKLPIWLGIIGLLSAAPGLLARLANWMLTIFFMRKKQRGVVYDAKTKQPIDPAYVSVIDVTTGREVMNQITDMDGRYGFILPQGRYRMAAGKTNYQFPSKYLAGKTSDEVYDHLYFGEEFIVADKEQVVVMNIPMDSVATDWNQQEKQRMHPIKFMFENQAAWMWFFNILFAIGFVASIIITWFYPGAWNIVMTAMYVVVIALEAYGLGPVTVGHVSKNGQPVKNAIIRVINVALGREIAHKVTTDLGSYYILVPKADYYLTVEECQPDGTYVKTFTSGTVRAAKGLINKSFTIM